VKTSEKILKAGKLLQESLNELKDENEDQKSDLFLYLSDAEIASDHAYQHCLIKESSLRIIQGFNIG